MKGTVLAIGGFLSVAGGTVIAWWLRLSEADRKNADQAASRLAMRIFGVAFERLTPAQAEQIRSIIRRAA